MAMWDSVTTARDLGRLQEIASILIRHGFSDLIRRMGLEGLLTRAGRVLPVGRLAELAALPAPERARRALEEMGPTFVKLGQVMATRLDLFGPEWIAELERLQSQAAPVPFESIREQMVEDLGAAPEQTFRDFDTVPLASASIAQVHRARLPDGAEVVVKVRRPGIRPIVEADLRLIRRAAQVLERRLPEFRRFQPSAVVQQFTASLKRELDLAAECRHAERVAASFADHQALVVPSVVWRYTSERMNVQGFVDGIPASNIQALDAAGIDRPLVARHGAEIVLKMALRDGFFHADPHPGNVFVLPGNRIAFVDYGMVGRLSRPRRDEIVTLLHALVEHDTERVTDALLEWASEPNVDAEQLSQHVDAFLDRYHGVPLGQLDLSRMLLDMATLLRERRLTLPPELALLTKVFVTLEGMGRSLDPGFDMARQTAPLLKRLIVARYEPGVLLRHGGNALVDLAGLLSTLPRDLRRLMCSARAGTVRVHVEVDNLKSFSQDVDRSATRLTVGVVLAALIIGSSIALTARGGPTLLGLPLFGLLGFVGAGLAGIWLLFSIWRTGGGSSGRS